MSRWTTYDSVRSPSLPLLTHLQLTKKSKIHKDAYRLPSGMERIGYDSDSRRYTFRDQRGVVWVGLPGEEFGGEMERVSGPSKGEYHITSLGCRDTTFTEFEQFAR